MDYLIVFGLGLLVGWNVLPQPEWVQALYLRVTAKFRR